MSQQNKLIQTKDINKIKQYFTEPGFNPIKPVILTSNGQTLLGARYCSIQGIAAAQMRLKNSTSGEIQSLYQTIYDKKTFKTLPDIIEGEKPLTVYSKGLAIDIWLEKGLLFALTKEKNAK